MIYNMRKLKGVIYVLYLVKFNSDEYRQSCGDNNN